MKKPKVIIGIEKCFAFGIAYESEELSSSIYIVMGCIIVELYWKK